ncbi:MAG: exodeoxyribonuclease V subunit alpha [Polyangiaceae bacterium]|nr:exodeoxyribonuclease V subunit alpha [Polyangiaceae bacterium]
MSEELPSGAGARRFLSRQRLGNVPGTGDDSALLAAAPFGSLDPDGDDVDARYVGWEVARCAPGLDAIERRALTGLAAACVTSMRAGSTRLPLVGAPFSSALAAVGADDVRDVALRLVRQACAREVHPVQAVIGVPGDRKPLIVEREWLYPERMRILEDRFCTLVRERLGTPAAPARAAARAALAASSRGALTEEQQAAVRDALRSPLALVTGGPGTGKTTTVVALVRAVAWLGTRMDAVAIAAPTGKAAQRLADAIAAGLATAPGSDITEVTLASVVPPPTTLHRLLGWSAATGRFARHENDPLPHRVVIVDEASMVDLALMDRLVRALRRDARLVLLGDADQLPSVEAGAVFRDLCAALPARRLTQNLRVARDPNARRILAAARAVNAGALDASFDEAVTVRAAVDDVALEGVEHVDRAWSAVGDALLERWWSARTQPDAGFEAGVTHTYRLTNGVVDARDEERLRALFAYHQRSRILCVTRVLGIPASAEAIHAQIAERAGGRRGRGQRFGRDHDLEVGTPVMVRVNDYARGLFNGDQGVVARVDPGDGATPCRMAIFPRGSSFVAFAVDAIADLAPAFAMTVHKAQGSEFDHVTLVLPETDSPLLTRELVYTAVTRARRSVLIVGPRSLLARAVGRVVERCSGVAERLRIL